MELGLLEIYQLLRSDGCIVVNKNLANNIGINESILFSELISKCLYFMEKNELDNDGFFFNTIENLKKDTCLSEFQQRKVIKTLQNIGLLEIKLKGSPPKRHFKLTSDIDLLLSQIRNKSGFKSLITQESIPEKVRKVYINNTKFNNTKLNNFISKEIKKGNTKVLPKLTLFQNKEITLIELWNKLTKKIKNKIKPSIHKLPKNQEEKPSKLIIDITSIIIELKSGTFFNQNKLKNKIKDSSILRKKFTEKEIKSIIRSYFKLFLEGYSYNKYEINTSKLAKNMKDFFYNNRTNLSYFLTIAENPVLMISDKSKTDIDKPKIITDNIIIMYKEIFGSYWDKNVFNFYKQIEILYKEMNNIYDKHKYYYEGYNNNFTYYFNDFFHFCIIHTEYLKEKFGFSKNLSYGHLNINGKVWTGFTNYIYDNYGFLFLGTNIEGCSDEKIDKILNNRKKAKLKDVKKDDNYAIKELV